MRSPVIVGSDGLPLIITQARKSEKLVKIDKAYWPHSVAELTPEPESVWLGRYFFGAAIPTERWSKTH